MAKMCLMWQQQIKEEQESEFSNLRNMTKSGWQRTGWNSLVLILEVDYKEKSQIKIVER
jgi:hypothetical protein